MLPFTPAGNNDGAVCAKSAAASILFNRLLRFCERCCPSFLPFSWEEVFRKVLQDDGGQFG
jgi:hypothetical protein